MEPHVPTTFCPRGVLPLVPTKHAFGALSVKHDDPPSLLPLQVMSLREQLQNFTADVERDINDFIIKEYERKMPIRLIDTYTGLILKRSEITSLLKERGEYLARLEDVIQGATGRPIDSSSQRPSNIAYLEAFIAEYLAFAMFSHRWGEREIIITDVREATGGIYSIVEPPRYLSGKMATDFLDGAKKLQEFCCVAAKCGYRWAWADTCCIDERVYGEKSESLNSMFLWYRNSDLTIVYLGDVEDIDEEDRLPAMESQAGVPWFHDLEIQSPFPPSYPYSPNTSQSDTAVTLHDCSKEESPLRLASMQLDTQVESSKLEDHLKLKFPYVPDWIARHIYRGVPAWVTRGWTLQEMLASKRLRFYSKNWTLLEEASDPDTDEAEKMIAISSFKYRARLMDHRAITAWCDALQRTTEVPKKDLVKFEPGPKDIRNRLRWAARRRTEKVEDMAYCMLGIFDVTLPAMYGEGNRAFFRLQEEIMKRTGDTSLFDWCGASSSVNSFLAYRLECFIEPNHPDPYFDDWTGSTFRMIMDLLSVILGTVWSGVKAAIKEVLNRLKNAMESAPPGHALVNGELNVSLFEHQVKHCKREESSSSEDDGPYCHYKLEIDGLRPTHVILKSRTASLENNPTSYYLCRVWNQHTHNVFHVLLELIEYVLKDSLKEVWHDIKGNSADSDSACPESSPVVVDLEEDEGDKKLRVEMEKKRKQVLGFFKHPFPAFLIRVEDGRRIRVNTVRRVVSDYAKFDFTMPVVTRLIL